MNDSEYVMPFGNYRGKSLETIYKTDPQYLFWCRDNWEGWSQPYIERFLKAKNEEIIARGKKKAETCQA